MMRAMVSLVLTLGLAGCGGTSGPGGSGGSGGSGGGGGSPHNWLAGDKGTLAASVDGEHYQLATSGTTADLQSLFCVGHLNGWAAGVGGVLLTTLDGGANWHSSSTGVSATLRAVAFADPAI